MTCAILFFSRKLDIVPVARASYPAIFTTPHRLPSDPPVGVVP
jgi:hypothetical protein